MTSCDLENLTFFLKIKHMAPPILLFLMMEEEEVEEEVEEEEEEEEEKEGVLYSGLLIPMFIW